jgi:hypothetical protein
VWRAGQIVQSHPSVIALRCLPLAQSSKCMDCALANARDESGRHDAVIRTVKR